MTQKEKAKAYDEALERARKLYNSEETSADVEIACETIFPELAESEDERMKKAIMHILYENYTDAAVIEGVEIAEIVAWLEKQGEQKLIVDGIPTATNYDKMFQNYKIHKFNVGDFIVNDYCFGKVIEITNDAYLLDTGQGIPFSCEHNAHLWTIKDAKEGDILVNGSNIFIFSHLSDTRAMGYCHINLDDGRFYDDKGKNECFGLIAVFSPATKEQRDLLFAKMKDAGYEWDAEKKELRKIEQNLAMWTDEDEERLQSCIIALQGKGLMGGVDTMDSKWLKSLKQRIHVSSAKTCKNDTLYDLLCKMPSYITVDGIFYHFILRKTALAYTAYYAGEEEGSGKVIFAMTAFSPIDLLNEMLGELKEKGLLE